MIWYLQYNVYDSLSLIGLSSQLNPSKYQPFEFWALAYGYQSTENLVNY